jgi:glycine cleavage system regulatory protein
MKQHLAVSAIGSDRTGMVHELTRVISECGGNISESRMASLGSEFAMLLLVSGNWHALAKLETELKRLAESNSLSVHLKRTASSRACPASSRAAASTSRRSPRAATRPRTPARPCFRSR